MFTEDQVQTLADQAGVSYEEMADRLHRQNQQRQQPQDEVESTFNTLALSMASIVIGFGIIGSVVWLTIVPIMDLLQWVVLVLLPIAALAVGVGLISGGTLRSVTAILTSESFTGRVRKHLKTLAN